MRHYIDFVATILGVPVPGATVDVRVANSVPGAGALATIYSDDGITQTQNPLTCDLTGTFNFYVADGRYDLVVKILNVIQRTQADVEIADVTQTNLGDATFNIASANIAALAVSANQTIGGTLVVAGNTTLNSGTFNGTFAGNPTLSGNVSIGGTLGVTGSTTLNSGTFNGTFAGNHTLSGNISVGGTLGVTGTTTLNSGTLNGTFGGNPTLSGNVQVGGTLGVTGSVSSSHVGTTDATFTAGPINATLSAGFINSLTQTNQFAHGFADEANVSLTPAAGGYASFSAAPAMTLGVNTNHYNGYQFFPTIGGTGVLTSLIGAESAPVINTTSAVTELDDFYVQDWSGTGSVTTHRGLFIGPLTKAATNWGFDVQTPSRIGYASSIGNQLVIESEAAPSSGNGPAQLHITGAANPNEQLRLGFDTTALVGTIQAEIAGTGFNPLSLQPNGGSVLIGANVSVGTKVTSYNGTTTSGNGAAIVYGSTSQKAETTADAALLSFTPPATVGTYRLSFVLDVSAATAATLGWTATWKDSNGNAQSPANLSAEQVGVGAPALTFVLAAAGVLYGTAVISVDNTATAIVIKLTFTGTSFAAKASATIERLI